MIIRNLFFSVAIVLAFGGCQSSSHYKTTGTIERLDPALDNILDPSAAVEIISEGHNWSEGPLWLESQHKLIFSDVPENTIFQWSEEKGTEPYLKPSGWTGPDSIIREGSNGLLLDPTGKLVLSQHGDRRMARMTASLDAPAPTYESIADRYEGKRFNSPNDAAYYGSDLYFTDPPWGLPQYANDPSREIPFMGVYRVSADGQVTVLVDSLTSPNGIALSPDGHNLYVANSDPQKARWYRYDVNQSEGDHSAVSLSNGVVFYDATDLTASEKGLPDGMKINKQGIIFGTGPGGLFIFSPEGKLLGKVKLTEATSNCALSADEKTLYITNDMYILRIKLKS
jgi:gluconolactonase